MDRPVLLLVDAHEASRRACAATLRCHGFEVLEAHNGAEGLVMARDRPPRLIVLDPWPFVSASLQMVERLRARAATAHVRTLVVTRRVPARHRARALAAGCTEFVEKPCRPEEVLGRVRRLLTVPPGRLLAIRTFPLNGVAR